MRDIQWVASMVVPSTKPSASPFSSSSASERCSITSMPVMPPLRTSRTPVDAPGVTVKDAGESSVGGEEDDEEDGEDL